MTQPGDLSRARTPWHTAEMPRAFPAMAEIPPGPERYAWARRRIFAHDTAIDVVPDIVALGRRWQPHAIVRDAAEYGGYVAAELLGIPHAVVRTDSGSSSFVDRHHVGPTLDKVRAIFGLAPTPTLRARFATCRIRAAVGHMLDEPARSAVTQPLATEARARPGLEHGLDCLESLAAHRVRICGSEVVRSGSRW